jgi:uroporphyrinogen-III synthase
VTESRSQKQLEGLCVLTLESRRARELAELIRRHGGTPVVAPSMREIPLGPDAPVLDFARRLREGAFDVVIFMTGVGIRYLAEAVAGVMPAAELGRALASVVTVARGPKSVAALRELGVTPAITAPEPNTWRELLAAIDGATDLGGKRVALQEYGEQNPELAAALQARGAALSTVHVYRWDLPEDVGPLRQAAHDLVEQRIDAALFTNAMQVEHLFRVAEADSPALAAAFARVVVASIGPIATEALVRRGIAVDLEAAHPKMGALVAELAQRAGELVAAKRRGSG